MRETVETDLENDLCFLFISLEIRSVTKLLRTMGSLFPLKRKHTPAVLLSAVLLFDSEPYLESDLCAVPEALVWACGLSSSLLIFSSSCLKKKKHDYNVFP